MKRKRAYITAELQPNQSSQWMIIFADLLLLLLTIFVLRLSFRTIEQQSIEHRLKHVFSRVGDLSEEQSLEIALPSQIQLNDGDISQEVQQLFGAVVDSVSPEEGNPEIDRESGGSLNYRSGMIIAKKSNSVLISLPANSFLPGTDQLSFLSAETLDLLGRKLKLRNVQVSISSYVSQLSPSELQYASEWYLAIAQSIAASSKLQHGGLSPERIAVAGYAISQSTESKAEPRLEIEISIA